MQDDDIVTGSNTVIPAVEVQETKKPAKKKEEVVQSNFSHIVDKLKSKTVKKK